MFTWAILEYFVQLSEDSILSVSTKFVSIALYIRWRHIVKYV